MLPRALRDMYFGWWMVTGGFFLLFIYGGVGYAFSIFVKPLEDSFGWSRAAISLTMTIHWLGHAVCAPLIGPLLRAYGCRRVMTAAAFLSGLFFLSISLTGSLGFFYTIYALLSVVTVGIGFIPVSDIIAGWFLRRRGTAIGAAMVGLSTGGLILPPLASEMLLRFGWRGAFVFLGIMVWVVCLPVTMLLMKESPQGMGLLPDGEEQGAGPGKDSDRKTPLAGAGIPSAEWPFHAAVRSRAFLFSAVAFFFASLAQTGLLTHQVPILLDMGMSQTLAATALGLTASSGALGKLGFGRLTEIIPSHYAPVACFSLQAASILFLLFAENMAMVWVYVFLFGFAMGGVIVLTPLTVGHYFGLTAFGVILGALSFILAMGASCGALFSGIIYDAFGSYRFALIAYVGFYLTAVVSILLAGKPTPYAKADTNS